MLVIEDILGRCAPLLGIDPADLRRRNFYVDGQATPYGQPVRHPERLGDRLGAGARRPATSRRGRRRSPAFNAEPRAHQAGAGDHAGEVRHLVQLHGLQPGRRARARLQGRLGADQPRRHRDGPGPAHQDAAGRRDHARRPAGEGPARADPHRQGAQHLGHRGELGRRPQRRRGQERLRADPGAARGGRRRPRASPGRSWSARPTSAGSSCGRPASTAPRGCTGTPRRCSGEPFKYFAYGVAATEVEVDGFTGAYRTRRVDIVHDVGDSLSPLVDLGQIEGGFVQGAGWLTLEDLRWDESDGPNRGRLTTQAASTYKLPSFSRDARGLQRRAARAGPRGRRRLRLEGGRRAAADAGVLGARGAAPGGRGVRARRAPASTSPRRPRPRPSTGRSSRPGAAPSTATSTRGCPASCPTSRTPTRRRCTRGPSRSRTARPGGGAVMDWLAAVERLRRRAASRACWSPSPTCAGTRPRDAGAKMVVAADETWGSVGGGNLEETAIARARRAARRAGAPTPETMTMSLNDKARTEHGRQCCGGEVTAAARAAAGRARRSRSSGSATSASSWPGSSPGTTSSCTSSTRAPTSSPPSGWRCLDDAPGHACTSTTRRCPSWCSARCPRGTHVLVHDPRPRRGLRALRRRAALRAPRLDRPDRLVGEVAAVPAAGCASRGTPRPSDRPDPARPIGRPGPRRQGPRDHRA